jgi:hypothetical protein
MFNDLKELWITNLYKSYWAILLPSIEKQMTTSGLILDLDSLPNHPIPFKEFFIRWLISIQRDRIERGAGVIVTKEIVLACPLWKVVKCPLKRIKLTKEALFNRPTPSKKSIGTKGTQGSINK